MSVILITLTLLTTLIATVYFYVKNAFLYWKRRGVPYLEPTFPFGNAGKTFMQKLSAYELFEEHYNSTSEPVIGTYMFHSPALLIRDSRIIQDILIADYSSFCERGMNGNVDVDPLANNLLLQNGDKWKRMRHQISPAFTSGKLKAMFSKIVECGSSLDEHMDQFAESGETIEIRKVFERFTMNVVASVGFGIENPDEEFRTCGRRFFKPTMTNSMRIIIAASAPKLARFLRLRFADKDIGEFMIETVRQTLEYREKNNVVRKDFLQLMMQLRNTGKVNEDGDWSSKATSNEKTLTLEEIAAQAFIFFAAGYETASTTMAFCIYELARNPDAQNRVQEEIDKVLERHDGKLTYESIGEMKYLENCINETLRVHTPIGAVPRICTKEYKLRDSNPEIVIEVGTQVLIPISALHNDPKYYDQPGKFMPERFDEKNKGNKTFAPFLPFGSGPRNCIGLRLGILQIKVALVTMLKKYQFELGKQHVNRELRLDPRGIIKTPIDGINVKVHFRNNKF